MSIISPSSQDNFTRARVISQKNNMNDEEEVHMKFKKVLSMTLLAAMLATTLAACGNSGSGSSSGTKQESSSGAESGGTSSEGVTLPFAETQKYTMFSTIAGAVIP